jgi:hypothetical protein
VDVRAIPAADVVFIVKELAAIGSAIEDIPEESSSFRWQRIEDQARTPGRNRLAPIPWHVALTLTAAIVKTRSRFQ